MWPGLHCPNASATEIARMSCRAGAVDGTVARVERRVASAGSGTPGQDGVKELDGR
jgi:hypothetical protein